MDRVKKALMHTLKELRSGRLKGIKRLSISEDLTSFPIEILDLADTLEILDLSGNQLFSLPPEIKRLTKLKIAFFANNRFTHVPSVFKACENLYMLGFKANQIEVFDEDVLPLSISWLVLTDNKIKVLPASMGKLTKLQKCALAGNQIEKIPDSMAACTKLELLRLSANNIKEIPLWLLELPRLSWLAFSGNPCSRSTESTLAETAYSDLEIKELLGEGASGKIFRAHSKELGKEVAVKLFKGEVTSDGYAKDEMNAYMSTGEHEHLIKVLAKIDGGKGLGLLLELIPSRYKNLGHPPSLESCTRDTFEEGKALSVKAVYKIAKAILSASSHLHSIGLMHGDLYAHNILIDEDHHCYLGDFGAASFYDVDTAGYEKVEIRAFGCLLDDLLQLCSDEEDEYYQCLKALRDRCMHEDTASRPLFSEIVL